jgi:hypothetical protein
MMEEWFELEEEPGETFTAAELAFVDALRYAAVRWNGDSCSSWAMRADVGSALVAVVSFSDLGPRAVGLADYGVYLDGGRMRGDRLHNQLFSLPDEPTDMALDLSGTPEELAARAVEWFERLLARPVVLHEWLHKGQVYASRYLFEDTGEGLVQGYDERYAPAGQARKLIKAGHVFGRGWIQTSGLSAPDRIRWVRGMAPPASRGRWRWLRGR